MSHDILDMKIKDFLEADEKDQYWRAIEVHEELIGPGDEQLLEVKRILEQGVDDGIYKRKITTKAKRMLVGYQFKRPKASKSEKEPDDSGEGGWEKMGVKT